MFKSWIYLPDSAFQSNANEKELVMNTLIVNRVTISIVLVLISFCFITEATYGDVTISEIMYGSEIRFSQSNG